MLNGKRWVPLTGLINPPSANSTGTSSFRLPTNVRIHGIELKLTLPAGKVVSDCFEKILLRLGTDTPRELTLTQHDDLLSLDGPENGILGNQPGGVAYVPVPFSEFVRDNSVERENFALDVPGGLVGYVDLKQAAQATQAVMEGIICYEPLDEVAGPKNLDARGLPVLVRHKVTNPVVGGTQNDLEALIPALQSGRLQSAHIYNADKKITRVTIQADGERFDLYKEDVDVVLQRAGLHPRDGIFDIVTDIIGKNSDAWNMSAVNKLLFRIYHAAAATGTCDVVTKTYGPML